MDLGGGASSPMDAAVVQHPGRNASPGGGSGGGAAAAAGGDAAGGAGDEDVPMADDHPFEDFIANFLDQVCS